MSSTILRFIILGGFLVTLFVLQLQMEKGSSNFSLCDVLGKLLDTASYTKYLEEIVMMATVACFIGYITEKLDRTLAITGLIITVLILIISLAYGHYCPVQ